MQKSSHLIFILILFFTGCTHQKEAAEKKVSIADVEAGIRDHILEKSARYDGVFRYESDTLDLSLKLVRIHTEYLSILGPEEFFACVDLATENGDVYDMDFFLKGKPGAMVVTRTDLHKLNGKPYYTWKQTKDKTWVTVPVKNATNELLGVIEGTDKFEFTYEVVLPKLADSSAIWIPLAQNDLFQNVEIISKDVPDKYQVIDENENTILYMALSPEHSNRKIKIVYQVERKEKSTYKDSEAGVSKYLEATPLLPVGDRFAIIAESVINAKQATTPLTKARALYDHVIEEIRYAKNGIYGTGDANYACDSKSGNCTEFHSYFISLARSAGIPARFAVGAAIPSERNEGGVNGYHCWAEFYAEGKWWPVDISEANKYSALATYYFGHHPANRIEFSKGRNLKPDPLPRSGPINFLAYPVLEINGEPGYVETKFSFRRN